MTLNKSILPLLLAATILPAAAYNYQTTIRSTNNPGGLEAVLSNIIGKSVLEANLFDNATFRKRIVELVGPARYQYMKENSDYPYPIEYSKGVYNIAACKSDKCGITDYEIQYFAATDNICIKYNIGGDREIFMNKDRKVRWSEFGEDE